MEFRTINASDFDSCAEASLLAFSAPPWNEKWTFEQCLERIEQIMSSPYSRGWVAALNGEVMAMCLGNIRTYTDWKEIMVDDFCVAPAFQGKGIGSQLLGYVKEEMKQEGIGNLALTTIKGMPAVGFYEKNGFKISESVLFMHT